MLNIKTIGAGLLDLIFPPRSKCPFCGCFQQEAAVCGECHRIITGFSSELVCSVCGRFFQDRINTGVAAGGPPVTCRECREATRPFLLARAAGPYEGILRDAIHRLKFSNHRSLAGHLARYMVLAARANLVFNQARAVVPVPVSAGRLRERGFNQAELLGAEVARGLGIPLLKAVRKIRETPAQTSLVKIERKSNLNGAFTICPEVMVKNSVILVVDDVITTGSTMEAVSGVLLGNGVSRVIGLAAAAGRTGL